MPHVTSRDGTSICHKGRGSGMPIVFSHGWPLSGDAWEAQMLHLAHHGTARIAKPVLAVHGDADHVVPLAASGRRAAKLAPRAVPKICPGIPHARPGIARD